MTAELDYIVKALFDGGGSANLQFIVRKTRLSTEHAKACLRLLQIDNKVYFKDKKWHYRKPRKPATLTSTMSAHDRILLCLAEGDEEGTTLSDFKTLMADVRQVQIQEILAALEKDGKVKSVTYYYQMPDPSRMAEMEEQKKTHSRTDSNRHQADNHGNHDNHGYHQPAYNQAHGYSNDHYQPYDNPPRNQNNFGYDRGPPGPSQFGGMPAAGPFNEHGFNNGPPYPHQNLPNPPPRDNRDNRGQPNQPFGHGPPNPSLGHGPPNPSFGHGPPNPSLGHGPPNPSFGPPHPNQAFGPPPQHQGPPNPPFGLPAPNQGPSQPSRRRNPNAPFGGPPAPGPMRLPCPEDPPSRSRSPLLPTPGNQPRPQQIGYSLPRQMKGIDPYTNKAYGSTSMGYQGSDSTVGPPPPPHWQQGRQQDSRSSRPHPSGRHMRTERTYSKERRTRTCAEKAPVQAVKEWQADSQGVGSMGRWNDGVPEDLLKAEESFGDDNSGAAAVEWPTPKLVEPEPEGAPNSHLEIEPDVEVIGPPPKKEVILDPTNPAISMEEIAAKMQQFEFGASDSDE